MNNLNRTGARYFSLFFGSLFLTACGSDSDNFEGKLQDNIAIESNEESNLEQHLSSSSEFNNCTAGWVTDLSTNPLAQKKYSGDTHAGYAIFAFRANKANRYMFKIEGRNDKTRFFSYETYEGPLMALGNHIFDHDLVGNHPNAPAYESEGLDYELLIHPPEDRLNSVVRNTSTPKLEFTESKILPTIKSVMLRLYAPKDGQSLSASDLPKIYAYDPVSGKPKACPNIHHFKPFEIPQQLVTLMRGLKTTRILDFGAPPKFLQILGLGTNAAVKGYVLNTTRIDSPSDVAVVRFRAPISAGSSLTSEVRYWSFCINNFAKNMTLACLPDSLAKKDYGQIITVVFARPNTAIEQTAKSAGYYFLPDTRLITNNPSDLQRVVGFVYRNLYTTAEFDSVAYTGDYKPIGKICTQKEFLDSRLRQNQCMR